MTHKYKAVIFDIDGTLTTTNSWNVLTEKLGGDVERHHKIYLTRTTGAITLQPAREQLITLWTKTGNANKKFIEKIFEKIKLRPEALEVFSYLDSKNYLTCLITGSNSIFAKEVAKKLNVKHFYANCQLRFDKNGSLIHYDYEIEQGMLKLEQLKDFCQKQNISLADCVIVGNSLNDIEMFKATGHGIAVKTEDEEPEIEEVAYKTVDNLNQLKKIL